MLRPILLVLVPGCVALMVAGAMLVIHPLHPPLAAEVQHSAEVGRYQLQFRCGLELLEMKPPPTDDSATVVVDSVMVEQ